jgi:hypothetical protein
LRRQGRGSTNKSSAKSFSHRHLHKKHAAPDISLRRTG